MDQLKKCNRCRANLPISSFEVKKSGDIMRNCIQCNTWFREYQRHHKCVHNKTRCICKDCLCEHNKFHDKCADCGVFHVVKSIRMNNIVLII